MKRIEAKNDLRLYCIAMRSILSSEKLKDKLEVGDVEKIEFAVRDTLDWLDKNQLAERDEFLAKHRGLVDVVKPKVACLMNALASGVGERGCCTLLAIEPAKLLAQLESS